MNMHFLPMTTVDQSFMDNFVCGKMDVVGGWPGHVWTISFRDTDGVVRSVILPDWDGNVPGWLKRDMERWR
jgi:hypothetical protein